MITALHTHSSVRFYNYLPCSRLNPTKTCSEDLCCRRAIKGEKKDPAKITELTVKLHELLFIQDLIVLLGDTHAAFRQQHRCTNSRQHRHGVDETEQLREHFDGGMRCRRANVRAFRGSWSETGLRARCFLAHRKTSAESSFSAGDQRRHV